MRVLVATDQIDGRTSAEAGTAVGRGWLRGDPAAQVAVVPMACSGEPLVRAAAAVWGTDVSLLGAPGAEPLTVWTGGGGHYLVSRVGSVARAPGLPDRSSSRHLGSALDTVLGSRSGPSGRPPASVVLDLGAQDSHDAGAGLLAALGARTAGATGGAERGWSALPGLDTVDLGPVRERLAGAELVGLVAETELEHPLLGLRGVTSRRGRADGVQTDPGVLLAADAALEHFARLAAPEHLDRPGAGAAGGSALAVLALGGRLSTGPRWLAEQTGLTASLQTADLVVTGAEAYDFAHRGGPVVQQVSAWAEAALRPCVVLAGTVQIGLREMRLMGVEGAHPLTPGPDVADPLVELAARVARSWSGPGGSSVGDARRSS